MEEQDVLEVRPARATDVPELIPLLRAGFKFAKHSFDRALLESYPKGALVFVGHRHGTLVATAALEPASTERELELKLKVPLEQIALRPVPCAVLQRVTGEKGAFWSMLPLLVEVCELFGLRGMLGLHPKANKMHEKYEMLGVRIDDVRTSDSIFPGEVQSISILTDFQALRPALRIHAAALHCRPCIWHAGSAEAAIQDWRDDDHQSFICCR